MSNKRQKCELDPCPCCQCHRAAKQSKQQEHKKHLYLILDDWERGYSVYKVDVESFDALVDAAPEPVAVPLPEPPVVRFETRHGSSWYFASHGTKILAMQPSPYPAFPVFDVQTTALAVCPWPRHGSNRLFVKPLFASVAGSLYLLRAGQFDTLSAAAPPPDSIYPDDAGWSWSRTGAPPPFEHCERIWASALHPDGRTLFVSHKRNTFSFDTESKVWASHGSWTLPFKGEAFFDAELDAWVGLCCHQGGKGYLAYCDVAPAPADLTSMPAWKLGKDRLFDAASRRHLGATLVCMGSSSRYCLVESLARDDEEDLRRLHDDGYYPHRRVLAVTTLGLKYDKQGQLVATQRKVRSYEMTDAHLLPDLHWNPVAFWM